MVLAPFGKSWRRGIPCRYPSESDRLGRTPRAGMHPTLWCAIDIPQFHTDGQHDRESNARGTRLSGQYIPPIPPPGAGASFFSGISATSASVVSRSDAID